MEYCYHIWGESSSTLLLDSVEAKAKRLINCPILSNSLDPLSLRDDIGAQSLYYRYYKGMCSRQLTSHIPQPLRRPRKTRGALLSHEYCVNVGDSRFTRCGASFFPATSVSVSYTHLRAHET